MLFFALILGLLIFIVSCYLLKSLVNKLVNCGEISLEAAANIALIVIVTSAKHHLLQIGGLGYATPH